MIAYTGISTSSALKRIPQEAHLSGDDLVAVEDHARQPEAIRSVCVRLSARTALPRRREELAGRSWMRIANLPRTMPLGGISDAEKQRWRNYG
jgi:hypothetical protein